MDRRSRRHFLRGSLALAGLGLLSGCSALPAVREPARVPRVGLLLPGPQAVFSGRAEEFRQGLRELGYEEGRNLVIDYRYAELGLDELHELAGELVRLQVDVIVTAGRATHVVAAATSTIPIVFAAVTDPIGSGLVASLARPGGNLTGLTNFSEEIDGKRLELLAATSPGVTRVAHLWDPASPPSPMPATARALGIQLQRLEAQSVDDLERAFEAARAERVGAQRPRSSTWPRSSAWSTC